ncbi:YkuS family protein [Peribacillus sp. NPDC096379]|uniref:YkuS family protein n=1 Tax=Peribacillus sp. NPDC096379 TaxID=3364393 RepID=UPI003811A786
MQKIAVEGSLTNISEALREKGYDVVELKQESDAQNVDFCVVTGLDSNMMGIQEASAKGSVIEASGLSADEVINELENKINHSH